MDIKIVDSKGEEAKPEVALNVPDAETTVTGELLTNSVGQMFNLMPEEISRNKDKIGLLIDYAKSQTDDTSPEAIKWAIRSLQNKVGTPPLGQAWIPYLSQYAYIKLEGLKFQKEAERYERT